MYEVSKSMWGPILDKLYKQDFNKANKESKHQNSKASGERFLYIYHKTKEVDTISFLKIILIKISIYN
jgi:hypothetical protein